MNAIQKHYALFPETRKFVFGEKKNVSGIVYAPLTVGCRAVYPAAYVAAYVVSPGRHTSHFFLLNHVRFVFRKSLATKLPVRFMELAHYGC